MIIITDTHEDKKKKVTVKQCQYWKCDLVGPWIDFILQQFASGEIRVSFRKGIKCEDAVYMEEEDTKIHLISLAVYELLEQKKLPINLNTKIGDFKFSYGISAEKIEAKITERVLRKADI